MAGEARWAALMAVVGVAAYMAGAVHSAALMAAAVARCPCCCAYWQLESAGTCMIGSKK